MWRVPHCRALGVFAPAPFISLHPRGGCGCSVYTIWALRDVTTVNFKIRCMLYHIFSPIPPIPRAQRTKSAHTPLTIFNDQVLRSTRSVSWKDVVIFNARVLHSEKRVNGKDAGIFNALKYSTALVCVVYLPVPKLLSGDAVGMGSSVEGRIKNTASLAVPAVCGVLERMVFSLVPVSC